MKIESVSKAFQGPQGELTVLDNLSFEAPTGEITVLMGPSGCGKTTILRLIGGLEELDQGSIVLEESEKGPISYLFQEPRLLPWKSVYANVELVLRSRISSRSERHERTMHVLEMVQMEHFSRFKPAELSGGMRQRVALARAFAFPSTLMLLDEPFQGLDYPLRFALLKAFLRLWEAHPRTVLYVTHEATEATLSAHTVLLLKPLPAQVGDFFTIGIPQSERRVEDNRLLALQGRIYRALQLNQNR